MKLTKIKLENLYLHHPALSMEIKKDHLIKETFKVRPINYYASTKIVCEKLIRRSFANYKSKFIHLYDFHHLL